jgi:hypothetical protein
MRGIAREIEPNAGLGRTLRGARHQREGPYGATRRQRDSRYNSYTLGDTTWQAVAALDTHPCAAEVRSCLRWKEQHSLG